MKRLLALVAAAGALAGCGPVRATSNLLDAEVQIQAARTAANLYIRKAREEVSYSDYQAGVDFAEKASRFANQAREQAMANANADEALAPGTNP